MIQPEVIQPDEDIQPGDLLLYKWTSQQPPVAVIALDISGTWGIPTTALVLMPDGRKRRVGIRWLRAPDR